MHGNLEVLCYSGHIPVTTGFPRIYLPVTPHEARIYAGHDHVLVQQSGAK
jgi:hypothetical protein